MEHKGKVQSTRFNDTDAGRMAGVKRTSIYAQWSSPKGKGYSINNATSQDTLDVDRDNSEA